MPEAKILYDKIEWKAQHGLLVRAPSWERLYINAALALVDSLIGISRVEIQSRKSIDVSAKDQHQLMAAWISAVCSLLTEDRFVPRRIVFEKFDGKKIAAAIHGEAHDRIRHGWVDGITMAEDPVLETGDSSEADGTVFYVKMYFKEWTAETKKVTNRRQAR
jgi:SHS2 domain-containing protein